MAEKKPILNQNNMWKTVNKILFEPITVHSYTINFQVLGTVTERGGDVSGTLFYNKSVKDIKTFPDVESAKLWIEQKGEAAPIKILPTQKKQRVNMVKFRLFYYDADGVFKHTFSNIPAACHRLGCTEKYINSIMVTKKNQLGNGPAISYKRWQKRKK